MCGEQQPGRLAHVLNVLLGQPERARDRPDKTGMPPDQLAPGGLITVASRDDHVLRRDIVHFRIVSRIKDDMKSWRRVSTPAARSSSLPQPLTGEALMSVQLVADPAAPNPAVYFGSYLVFRKLEQNVRRFKQAQRDLAAVLGLSGAEVERAGATLVGRFEDGTPLTLQSAAGRHEPVENDIDYSSDPDGAKCPFHAHIRKTNPRGSGGFNVPAAGRADAPDGVAGPDLRRAGGRLQRRHRAQRKAHRRRGAVFMAFNSDLRNQFEFAQATWANNGGFPQAPQPPGLDRIIGQGSRLTASTSTTWGGTGQQSTIRFRGRSPCAAASTSSCRR
ncbi:MAG TPA: hypothetical protein VI357_24810 [Mycobacteriales bacterium]